jgi:hypothetical protein
LNSPLDIPFLPLAPVPWALTTLRDSLRESLKSQLETLPPFLHDTQVGLNLRLYYLNRDNDVTPPRSDNEAWTLGGSLAYQSGWLAHIFRLRLEGFGSQKLYGPERRDGTLLLLPGQENYATLGRAYGEVHYAEYTATLFRQYIATPYVNQQDNRMTPNTFEAYRVTGKYEGVQFTAGYVADTLLPQPDSVFDDATAFDPAVDMLNAIGDSAGPGWPVAVPGSVPGRVILGRHEDLDLGQRKG